MDENAGGAGPVPTIVGPRPEGGGAGARNVPRGMERLLTLAGISPEWRGDILDDPVGAARSAGIALSESEKAILGSVPPATISAMADSLAARAGRPVLSRAAAGIAAAALLATNLTGCDNRPVKGVQPDRPPSKAPYAPSATAPIEWLGSLDEALAKAKAGSRAVMAVFPHPALVKAPPAKPGQGAASEVLVADSPSPPDLVNSQNVLLADRPDFRKSVKDAGLLSVKVLPPLSQDAVIRLLYREEPLTPAEREEVRRYQEASGIYAEALKRCGLEPDSLPAVAFLAPDGTVLSKILRPASESNLVAAVKVVPPMLAKWMTERREPIPIPPVVAGERPDEPDPEPSP